MKRISLALAAAVLANIAAAGESVSTIGKRIEDFQLRDYRGKEVRLGEFRSAKAIVVAFVGAECPLVKLYAPRLEELSKEYGPKGVAFLGINSNVQDNNTEIAAFARSHGVTFPILKDPGNAIADRFGAVRTPEAFVLDAEGIVRYHGRIDDQYGVGYQKPSAQRRDLAAALDAVLAGQPVASPRTDAVGCFIGRVQRADPSGEITYSNQIARILQARCIRCHRAGEIAPFPLTSYDEVVGWSETIREVIDESRMPPWGANPAHGSFRNDARMSDDEKRMVREWVAHGSPEGNPEDLPPPVVFEDGWNIPKPDQVFYASEKPIPVPAEGVVDYMYLTVDPKFTEDKWIRACEVRPGNRAVLHHVIVFVRRPDASGLPLDQELIGGYAPGMPPVMGYPRAAAMVPKGSKFIFQMHYTPNGTAQEDHTTFGVVFADPKEVKTRIKAGMAANFGLKIPPHASNHEVGSRYTFRQESLLYSLTPHMHLRGKSFRYELFYPDGKKEILLDVPRFDFNWQIRYELAEPKTIPKGSKLVCTAHFDNSEANLANPDPTKEVRFGEQTWEEMMIGWFAAGTPVGDGKKPRN